MALGLLAGAAGAAPSDGASAAPPGRIWLDLTHANAFVHARIGARPAVFLLDSGSPLHVYSLAAARAAAVHLAPHVPANDVDGRTHPVFATSLAATIEDVALPPAPLVASAFVDGLQPRGRNVARFDGLLSPQHLASPGRALIVDLHEGKLHEATWRDAEAELARLPLLLGDVRAREDGLFHVDVQVGDRFLELVIDTGARHTTIYGMRETELPRDAVGMIDHRLRVSAGAVTRTVAVETRQRLEEAITREDGLLGMDVLQRCALAVDPERMLIRCAPADGMQAWQPMRRRELLQIGGSGGPVLQPRAAGGYRYRGDDIDADIDRDGRVHIHRHWSRRASERTEREEREWLLDETRAMRIELARTDSLRSSFEALPRLLQWVRDDPRWSMAERRDILFRIWDEAAEPDDAELGSAGAEARRIIAAFVRRELPRGSRDGYSDDELARLNARRPGLAPFDPYHPPPDVDRSGP